MKTCNNCFVILPNSKKPNKTGLCRICRNKEYKIKNKEQERSRNREFFLKNKDILRAKYQQNKAVILAKAKETYYLNQEVYREKMRSAYQKHKQIITSNPSLRETFRLKKAAYYRKYINSLSKEELANKRQSQSQRELSRYHQLYKKDINLILRSRLRTRLSQAIKGGVKSGSAVQDLGCSINKLKIYLQLKFYRKTSDGEIMTWANYGKNGWHIDHIVPLSKFNLSDPNELKKACHYTNLQPLWSKDNLKKSNKIQV